MWHLLWPSNLPYMSSHLFSPCQSFPIYLYFHLSNNAKNSPQKSGISFPLSTMINIHRFCQMLTGFSLFKHRESTMAMNVDYTIHFMITIFENWISNKPNDLSAQCCRATAVRMCLKSGWREPGNCEPLSPFLRWLLWGEACAEVVRSPTIPSNKPLWDLHEHCCKYLQAVCKVRALSTFRGGRLTRQVWTFTVIE